jgi:hypothetical protein
VLAFKIFTERITYEQAYNVVKAKRACINPNMTFITQLIWFHKRLYDANFDCLPVIPRVYLVSSHEREDSKNIVARLQMENLYTQ